MSQSGPETTQQTLAIGLTVSVMLREGIWRLLVPATVDPKLNLAATVRGLRAALAGASSLV